MRLTAYCRGAFCHTAQQGQAAAHAIPGNHVTCPPLQVSLLARWSSRSSQPGRQLMHRPVRACDPAGILAEQSSPCTSHKPHTPVSTPAGIVAAVVVAAIVAAVLAAFLVKRRRNARRQSPPHRQAGKDFDSVVVDGEQCR